MNGVLVIDKPEGPTSFDVIARVRRLLEVKKVGHTGTLDPMATGVLPVCLGEATKIASYLAEADKEYEAIVRLGAATDTQDRTGTVVATGDVGAMVPDRLQEALGRFRGDILQVPPMYSAVRVSGRRLYEVAREGGEVDRKPRPVTVHALEVLSWSLPDLRLRVRCSKGTYIRTLAHDLGEVLSCKAHLFALRRTMSAGFSQSLPLDGLMTLDREAVAARLVSCSDALRFLRPVALDGADERRVRCGQKLAEGSLGLSPGPSEGERVRLISSRGELVAIAEWKGDGLRLLRVLNP
jgi:tRNA pseudouridine55 synthase